MELQNSWSPDSTTSAGIVYQNDGIDLQRDHLRRKDAVVDIVKLTRERKHIVLGSPPAMGKTSLLQLVKKELLQQDDKIKVLHRCLTNLVKVERVVAKLGKLGIKDDEDSSSDEDGKGASAETPYTYRETWILLDDAQNWYAEEYWSFWQHIVKHLPIVCSKAFYVIIAATYDLSTHSSPVQFATLEHYRQTAIQEEEVGQLYQMHIADKQMKTWVFYLDNL